MDAQRSDAKDVTRAEATLSIRPGRRWSRSRGRRWSRSRSRSRSRRRRGLVQREVVGMRLDDRGRDYDGLARCKCDELRLRECDLVHMTVRDGRRRRVGPTAHRWTREVRLWNADRVTVTECRRRCGSRSVARWDCGVSCRARGRAVIRRATGHDERREKKGDARGRGGMDRAAQELSSVLHDDLWGACPCPFLSMRRAIRGLDRDAAFDRHPAARERSSRGRRGSTGNDGGWSSGTSWSSGASGSCGLSLGWKANASACGPSKTTPAASKPSR
jgi:hypothetical protein